MYTAKKCIFCPGHTIIQLKHINGGDDRPNTQSVGVIMKGFAMLSIGNTGWIEKDVPICGPNNSIVKPIALAPCTSDVHTV